MTTQWTGRTRPSPNSSLWKRTPTQSDYTELLANDSTIIQDNDGNDILIHSGEYYDKTTDWEERTAVDTTSWTKRTAI